MRRFVLLLALLLAAGLAHALPVGNPRYPDPGLWWVPDENGRFLQLDVGPDGYVFATISGFVGGTASYLVMQGPMALVRPDVAVEPEVIGTLESPLYEIAGGSCFDCPWRAPAVAASGYGGGKLTFFSSDELELEAFGRVATFRRFPLYTTAAAVPEHRYVGRWLVLLRFDDGRLAYDLVDIERTDAGGLRFAYPTPDNKAASSLTPCNATRVFVDGDGSLNVESVSGQSCFARSYQLHERDGALYGARNPAVTIGSIAKELVLYRVPPDWLGLPDAQSTAPGNPRYPDPGLWWVENENGRFLHLDVGPDGYVFATVSGFVDGVASYLVAQGPIALVPPQQFDPRPVIGTLESPLYQVTGGNCFDCAWRAPRVRASGYGTARFTFLLNNTIELDAFGSRTIFRRFPLFTTSAADVPQRYAGRWLALVRDAYLGGVQYDLVGLEQRPGGNLWFTYPLPPGIIQLSAAQAALQVCGNSQVPVNRDGSLSGFSAGGLGCITRTYDLHERDGALYGQRWSYASAGEVLLYRVPAGW